MFSWCILQYAHKQAMSLSFDFSPCIFIYFIKAFEPAHDETYNKTCATSEDSDQPAHSRSLIRVFAVRLSFVQPPGYPRGMNENPSHTVWTYRLIWVFAGHTGLIVGHCRLCHALAHMLLVQIWIASTCGGSSHEYQELEKVLLRQPMTSRLVSVNT